MPKITGWTPAKESPLTKGGRCTWPGGEHSNHLTDQGKCPRCGATPIYASEPPLPRRPKTAPCSICGNPAPAPSSIMEDPLCTHCQNDMHRAPAPRTIEEHKIDIALDTLGNQTAIFDLFTDHAGGDEDAHMLIHDHEQGVTTDLRPRTLAFLEMIDHIPAHCPNCD